jgi:selenocysteine lyase/cysteine desulfurase
LNVDRREFMSAASGLAMTVAASGRTATSTSTSASSSASASDPLGVRGEFPVAERGTYLNTPYIGPVPRSVAEAGVEFVRSKAESPISLGDMLAKTNEVRGKFASLFGASPKEIGFLFATSEGENVVTAGLDLRAGDNVVVDDIHYTTSYVIYKTLERTRGIELRIVPSVGGRADVAQFEPHVDSRTRLVSVAWVSNQNGFRHDLKGLSEMAHRAGALLYADGIQALGMFPASLHEEGVDFVTSGTYKWLYGSFGVAPFYIREEHLERIAPDRLGELSLEEEGPDYQFRLYPSARKYEYATLAFGPIYQLGAALDFLSRLGLPRIGDHGIGLAAKLRNGLVERGFQVRTPENNASAIVAFVHGKDPEAARALFDRKQVRVSFRENDTQIRAGVGVFNVQDDLDRFFETVDDLRKLVSASTMVR